MTVQIHDNPYLPIIWFAQKRWSCNCWARYSTINKDVLQAYSSCAIKQLVSSSSRWLRYVFFSLLPNLKIFTATTHWHMHVFTFNRISLTGMILFHFFFRFVFFLLLVDFQLVFDIQWASLFNFLVPSTDCSLLKFLFRLSTSHTTQTHTSKYRYFFTMERKYG